MVYVLSEKQKAVKAQQDQKRYYEKKEEKIKMKALALEKKNALELARKELIKKNKIYNFRHMNLKRPKYGPEIKPISSNILLNDLIINSSESESSDSEIDPVPYEQPSALKYKFV